jgi:hypothetical protein
MYGDFPRTDAEAYDALAQTWEAHMLRDGNCLPVIKRTVTVSDGLLMVSSTAEEDRSC